MTSHSFSLGYRKLPAWLALLVGLVLTGATWWGLVSQAERGAAEQFELHVRDTVERIDERLRQHEQILLGAEGLFQTQGEVSRKDWQTYVRRLNLADRFPGIQGVGFSQLIPASQLLAHVAAVRAEGFPQYAVRPPGAREVYTSIVYLEPFSGRNLAAFGYDMMSEPVRGQAMQRAGLTGSTAISGKVRLQQETHGKTQAGFLMYVPVYRAEKALDTPEQRWAALRGFVYSPYRMNDLMRGVLGERVPLVDFAIHDGPMAGGDNEMFNSREDFPGLGRVKPAKYEASRRIQAYGHIWTVALTSRPEFEARFDQPQMMLVLLLGLGISLLLFQLVSFLVTRRQQAEALALQMTAAIRHREEQLQRSELRLQEAQRTAQVGNWELDQVSGQLFWSDEIFRLFEIDQDEFEASYQGFVNVIHPEDRAAVDEAYRHSLNTRQPYEIKHRLQMRDGRIKWVLERCSTDFADDGKPLLSRGTVQDITQLTLIERTAQDNARFVQAILDNAVDGILTVNAQGQVQSFNRAAETIFSCGTDAVLGRDVRDILPDIWDGPRSGYLTAAREAGEVKILAQGLEMQGRRSDGSLLPVELAISCSEHQGRALFIVLVRDITERKRIDKLKNEFVSTVSHELHTPLTSIRGALGLVAGGALGEVPEQILAMLKIASSNTERLLLLINDILDIQKMESDQMVFRLQELEVMPFIRQVMQDMTAYGQQHRVRFELTEQAPGAHISADQDRLAQVLANLLSNAAKFSPPDSVVEVAVQVLGPSLRISVCDHGDGIPLEFQPRLFERFTQADSSDARSKGGAGLGLAITKTIVEKHGGRISFESESGRGTCFHVDLPLLSGVLHVPSVAALPASLGAQARRILVVDDDEDVADLIQAVLQQSGYPVDLARDAEQARALLARNGAAAYALLTLDVLLPGEDGISFLRDLRKQEDTRDLPVMVLSVCVDETRQALTGGVVGVQDWLAKPFDPMRLVAQVQTLIAKVPRPRILHVEDDLEVRQVMATLLADDCELIGCDTLQAADQCLHTSSFDLVLLDVELPDGSGLSLLPVIEQRVCPPHVIVFSAQDIEPRDAARVQTVLRKSQTSLPQLMTILRAAMRQDPSA